MSNISRIGRRHKRPKFVIDDAALVADYAKGVEECEEALAAHEALEHDGDDTEHAHEAGRIEGRMQVWMELRDGLRKAMAGKPS